MGPMISNYPLCCRPRDPLNIEGALAEIAASERKILARVVRLAEPSGVVDAVVVGFRKVQSFATFFRPRLSAERSGVVVGVVVAFKENNYFSRTNL